ncbi:hypothetical protein FIBSPDRAFT_905195 [Athelia psychrophila]|uniref:Uncharacterized protein n=1 Tax=Athelia psychrophila TaxID=1759441 RepID=A0A167TRH7_9AGAM|nr:hypothetical protein FIBSPDRAFT_905195 [Fibularhizoctonia sp. CBS 109695]
MSGTFPRDAAVTFLAGIVITSRTTRNQLLRQWQSAHLGKKNYVAPRGVEAHLRLAAVRPEGHPERRRCVAGAGGAVRGDRGEEPCGRQVGVVVKSLEVLPEIGDELATVSDVFKARTRVAVRVGHSVRGQDGVQARRIAAALMLPRAHNSSAA